MAGRFPSRHGPIHPAPPVLLLHENNCDLLFVSFDAYDIPPEPAIENALRRAGLDRFVCRWSEDKNSCYRVTLDPLLSPIINVTRALEELKTSLDIMLRPVCSFASFYRMVNHKHVTQSGIRVGHIRLPEGHLPSHSLAIAVMMDTMEAIQLQMEAMQLQMTTQFTQINTRLARVEKDVSRIKRKIELDSDSESDEPTTKRQRKH